ncbi:MAG: hypothetical protein UHK60_05505 [Acutalibacteraceae bacterium]|nr:hypothetical protein [Acutalibacteraceae bacterium]
MNNQFSANKIPKFLYLLFGTFAAIIIFIIFVAMPLVQDGPSMQSAHQKHLQTVREYDNALKLEDSIEQEIKKNQAEFKTKEKNLFVDLDTSSREIEAYCREKNIDLSSYSLSEPSPDNKNRVSTGGYPVETVDISLSYIDTYEKTLNLLKYFETGSNGCYYVKSCSLSPNGDDKDEYTTSISMQLYYYNRTETIVEEATEAATEKKK